MFDSAMSCRDVERIIAEMAKGTSFDDGTKAILDKAEENLRGLCEILEMLRHPKP
jgi:hypothetical protein